jgi:hypothetical protein
VKLGEFFNLSDHQHPPKNAVYPLLQICYSFAMAFFEEEEPSDICPKCGDEISMSKLGCSCFHKDKNRKAFQKKLKEVMDAIELELKLARGGRRL